ncbi:[FeFe] hydrogenase H-cluster radical SAM maturase HydE [Syntrophomonas erecta]
MPVINLNQTEEILASNDPALLGRLLKESDQVRRKARGNEVYLRGLIEFSNYCSCNCFYCGLRSKNTLINRYFLSREEIIKIAEYAYRKGYHSICLQSGENPVPEQVDFLVELISCIKEVTTQNGGPGLGITLSIGELSYSQYLRLYKAGAHRYLLRIETSDNELFSRIHPPGQTLSSRLECLAALGDIGYQVGTGVMIGLPGQTVSHLVGDLKFFLDQDIDMLGMGPYIPHPNTPLARMQRYITIDSYTTSLKMLALARLLMPDINMVASTALQSIHPEGLKMGLKAGANIIMPVLTPPDKRDDYKLYAHKKFTTLTTLEQQVDEAGYKMGYWKWGDSPHWHQRRNRGK